MTDRTATTQIGVDQMLKNDVLVVIHPAGRRRRAADRTSVEVIEKNLREHNFVLVEKKDIDRLIDYFGDPWTKDAQHKICRAKQKHVFAVAYTGDDMNRALEYVNGYLGAQTSFFVYVGQRFIRLEVGVAVTRVTPITDHSGNCFVVELDRLGHIST